jgi:hypothetical protein
MSGPVIGFKAVKSGISSELITAVGFNRYQSSQMLRCYHS